jgi:hypothetical protein
LHFNVFQVLNAHVKLEDFFTSNVNQEISNKNQ